MYQPASQDISALNGNNSFDQLGTEAGSIDSVVDLMSASQELQRQEHWLEEGVFSLVCFLYLAFTLLSNSRTGIIYNVTKSAVGVIVNKKVGNRFIEKRVNLRIEHIKHSKCRDDFLRRVKDNAAAKLKAKADGVKVNLKRQPVQPRLARHVSTKNNTPVTLTAIPYDTLL
ncbi:hypothetical protein BGX31_011585 [Mortierella sp. GBA43]|nr:hypothetical protein BGX31_011585 [Mortierella sp. GBA43]